MTTTIDADPMTASVFLFQRQDTSQALAEALDDHGVLRSGDVVRRLATRIARAAAKDQLGVVADGLLNLDLGDLVIAGWRKHERLAAAAQRTAANPGSSERIQLATHRISSVHRPSVELLVNDTHLTNVNFELDIEFVITALEMTVRQGQVVSLHSGNCDISATLTAEGGPTGQPAKNLPAAAGRPLAAAAAPRRRYRPATVRGQVPPGAGANPDPARSRAVRPVRSPAAPHTSARG